MLRRMCPLHPRSRRRLSRFPLLPHLPPLPTPTLFQSHPPLLQRQSQSLLRPDLTQSQRPSHPQSKHQHIQTQLSFPRRLLWLRCQTSQSPHPSLLPPLRSQLPNPLQSQLRKRRNQLHPLNQLLLPPLPPNSLNRHPLSRPPPLQPNPPRQRPGPQWPHLQVPPNRGVRSSLDLVPLRLLPLPPPHPPLHQRRRRALPRHRPQPLPRLRSRESTRTT